MSEAWKVSHSYAKEDLMGNQSGTSHYELQKYINKFLKYSKNRNSLEKDKQAFLQLQHKSLKVL